MADAEKIREMTRGFAEVVMNERRIDKVDYYCAPEYVEHNPYPGTSPGREGLKESCDIFLKAFPDLRFTVEDIIVEGDKACVRSTLTGTHEGDLSGVPPTHRKVEVEAIDIIRVDDEGRALEHWGVSNELGMMQQLGLVPPEEMAA